MSDINKLAVVQANGISTQEYWEKRLLRMIVLESKNFVFSTLGREVDIPANQGTTTWKTRRYNHLPVGDHKLAEGTAPTALKLEGQTVTGTVDEFGALIRITNWVDDIHMDDMFKVYQPELARHAAEVKERNIMASFADASEYYCDASGAVNTAKTQLTDADVLTIKDARLVALTMKNFRRNGHPKAGGKPLLIVHTNVMQDLLDDDTLEKKLLVPGNENQVIKIGTLERYVAYGMTFMETLIAEVEAVNTGTESVPVMLNVYTSYMLGEDPYVVLKLKSLKWFSKGFTADSGDPLGQNAHVGYRFWTGAKVIDPVAITKMYSASAYDLAYADATALAADTWAAPASQA